MAALTPVQSVQAGVDIAAVAANAGGDTFANDGATKFHAINGSVGAIVITFVTSGTERETGLAVADLTVTVPAGDTFTVGPLNLNIFGSTVSVTYDGVTSLTVSVIKD